MSTANQKQSTVEMVPAVRVVAKRDGFRRAGRAWPASGAVVKRSELTKKQLDELCAEPNLVVQFTEIPVELPASSCGVDPGQGDRSVEFEYRPPADKMERVEPWPEPPAPESESAPGPAAESADKPEAKEPAKPKSREKK